ncbi:DUF6115 domain-containing protein [Paenibacillus sp. sgz302251]|uniref:DUF6115 domain-containing protein n=1 Tax=Paenibacillus sp. sgz302251 TaxID=3414493 RepID=UPI003C7D4E8C
MQPYLHYILLLGAVVIVGALALPRKKVDSAIPEHAVQNMETALEQFMENMEKDNDELVLLVKRAQQEAKAESDKMELRLKELERKYEQQTEQLQLALERSAAFASKPETPYFSDEPKAIHPSRKAAEQQVPPPVLVEQPTVNSIHARYSELFELYDQGKSIEMISKKLGMNKGEVQLIIQLAKQEGGSRA